MTLRFCDVRADYVAGAVQAAQHLDRIPLNPDILVPSLPADLTPRGALPTDGSPVHHSPNSCDRDGEPQPEETDDVAIHLSEVPEEDGVEMLKKGRLPIGKLVLEVKYPKDQTELPAGSIKQIELDDYHLLRIVGVALDSAAESLAEQRAEAIVQSWQLRDQQDQDLPAQSVVSMRLTMFIFGFGRIT